MVESRFGRLIVGRVSRPATLTFIGPMGAGKTEVGRAIAGRLGRPFRDTDAMVRRKAGKTISRVFDEDGEPAFRALESQAVRDAVSTKGAVIACGGGAVLEPPNVAAVRASGVVVYLKPSFSVALARVGTGKGRPLLNDDPETELAAIIKNREPLYRGAADHVVNSDGSVEEVVEAVLAAIGRSDGPTAREEPVHVGPS